MTLLLDVNLSRRVATALTQLGVDVHLVVDEMNPRAKDEAIIKWANGRMGVEAR